MLRDTVTWSWLLLVGTAAATTWTLCVVSAVSKRLRLASATARSVASLPEPAGMACEGASWLGMKMTPDRAAADAARSAAEFQ